MKMLKGKSKEGTRLGSGSKRKVKKELELYWEEESDLC